MFVLFRRSASGSHCDQAARAQLMSPHVAFFDMCSRKVTFHMAVQEILAPQPLAQGNALSKSVAHFARPSGPNLLSRTETFLRWLDGRRAADVWPYSRSITGAPGPVTQVRNEAGRAVEGTNFASTDYLGLATHPAIRDAAMDAIQQYGPHSPSSPMLQ